MTVKKKRPKICLTDQNLFKCRIRRIQTRETQLFSQFKAYNRKNETEEKMVSLLVPLGLLLFSIILRVILTQQ